jgi:LPS export ABC transporter protein LptC
MIQGPQRRDGLQTLGLCAVVMAAVFLLDAVLEQRDLAASRDVETAGQGAARTGPSPSMPDVVITGFQFLHALPKPGAKPLWQLMARTAALFEQRQEATMQAIHAVFQPNGAGGASGGELDGEEGRLDLGRLNFDVTGTERPVTVRLAKRYTLTTSRLHWDNASARMTTDQPVEIIGEGLTVTGVGFQWVQADGTILLLRNVRTVVTQ